MRLVKFIIAAVAAAFALPALPQTDQQRIDKRQANQDARIEQGVKSGQLTPEEAERLKKRQARIQKMEEKARADGKLDAKEKARIERAQDRQSKKIYSERRDQQGTAAGAAKGATKPAPAPQPDTGQARIDKRQANQDARIDKGLKSGQLTKEEADALRRQQERIRKMEKDAMADGKITPEEKAAIEREQDRASAKIYLQRRDQEGAQAGKK